MAFSFDRFSRPWLSLHALLNAVGMGILIFYNDQLTAAWVIAIGLSFVYYMSFAFRDFTFKPLKLGYANLVTTGRLLVLLVFTAFYQTFSDPVLFTAFLIVIILDGFDGWLARKFKQSSKEGEMLDAETDAQLVLFLSWIHYSSGVVDWWILIPGGMRYIYQLLFFWLPLADFPPKKVRATIAVIFFISLIAVFVLPAFIHYPLLVFASVLILCSFGLSMIKGVQKLFTTKA